MDAILWFVAALAIVFLINLSPAFMPSTWMVLAFFYIKFGLPLVPLALAGAIVSGLGRLCLARGSDFVTRTFFKSKERDLRSLGDLLNKKANVLPAIVFFYALTPLPTNNLFIAAGMVKADMKRVLVGFWAARIPADLFWIWTGNATFGSLKGVLEKGGSLTGIVLQLGALTSVLLLYVLPWGRWLSRYLERHSGRQAPGGSRQSIPSTNP